MMKKSFKKRGVSLIENVLYFALVGIVLLVIFNFAFRIFDTTQKSGNLNELSSNVSLIMRKVVNTVQMADSVNTGGSVFDNDVGTVSLNMPSGFPSPQSFRLEGGDILYTEGLNDPVKLNADTVSCSKFWASLIVYPKSPDQVVIDGECQVTFQGKSNLNDSQTFRTSVSLRK